VHHLTSLEATVAGFADNFVSANITVVTGWRLDLTGVDAK